MKDRIALWPPMMSTRERLRLGELAAHLRGGPGLAALEEHVPVAGRSHLLTSYGKGAFELAVREGDLAGKRIAVPAFISHDFVGVFHKYDLTPVFIDVDPQTFQIEREQTPEDVVASAAALILLHTFGLPAAGADFRALCDAHGSLLIEDCARALGGSRGGELVGSHGDYAAFSLSKIAPVRRGGLLVSKRPLDVSLPESRAGISGFVNALLLLKVPGLKFVEGPLYRLLRETPVYPGEIGLYEPPELERPEQTVRFFFEAFLPHYADALRAKRQRALEIRARLEPMGFTFQADPGNHIYTALGALVPPSVDKHALQSHLHAAAINSYTLWGDPLGTSDLARNAWGTDPRDFPVAEELADRLIHFPIGRHMGAGEVDRLVTACERFLG